MLIRFNRVRHTLRQSLLAVVAVYLLVAAQVHGSVHEHSPAADIAGECLVCSLGAAPDDDGAPLPIAVPEREVASASVRLTQPGCSAGRIRDRYPPQSPRAPPFA